MKKLALSLSLSLFLSAVSYADNTLADVASDSDAMKITSVSVVEEVPTADEIFEGFLPQNDTPNAPDDGLPFDWDKLIRIGKELIEIIKANQPVVNIKRDAVHVVPASIQNWQELTGWQMPVVRVFRVQMKNAFGNVMVDVRLKASAMWGGNYRNRGRYLANVVVVPTQIVAQWGVTLDIWSENREPVNVGTMEQPVAGLGFDLRYRAKTWVSEVNGTQDYFITGNGEMRIPE